MNKPKLVFLLDYDGTLTDFDRNPDHSRLTPEARSLLLRLGRKYPLFLVSGRNIASLRKVSGLKKIPMVGSHGFEASRLPGALSLSTAAQQKRFRREAAALWRAFHRLQAAFPGLHVERKPYSSTVHYRGLGLSKGREKELKTMFHRLVKATVTPGIWALQEGKMMMEAKPKGFSKGRAVLKIMRLFPGALPLFAGDDITDISAFKALGSRGLKVAVGHRIPKNLVNLRFDHPSEFLYWLKAFL